MPEAVERDRTGGGTMKSAGRESGISASGASAFASAAAPAASASASGTASIPAAASVSDGAPASEDAPVQGGAHREASVPASWTASLLADGSPGRVAAEASRFGVGIGLASLYGLALGAREGGLSLFKHAAGVPAAMIAVAALGVPALTIVLTLFNAPVQPRRALEAAARAAATTGLVLGGLAPAAALFVITSASPGTAAIMGLLGLVIGGGIGLRRLMRDLKTAINGDASEDLMMRSLSAAALLGFAVFAMALAARVWWGTLPILRGGAA